MTTSPRDYDNRNLIEMVSMLEDRVKALRKRIGELEEDSRRLRNLLAPKEQDKSLHGSGKGVIP